MFSGPLHCRSGSLVDVSVFRGLHQNRALLRLRVLLAREEQLLALPSVRIAKIQDSALVHNDAAVTLLAFAHPLSQFDRKVHLRSVY
jgi:hypothetical protein